MESVIPLKIYCMLNGACNLRRYPGNPMHDIVEGPMIHHILSEKLTVLTVSIKL